MISSLVGLILLGTEPITEPALEGPKAEASPKVAGTGKKKKSKKKKKKKSVKKPAAQQSRAKTPVTVKAAPERDYQTRPSAQLSPRKPAHSGTAKPPGVYEKDTQERSTKITDRRPQLREVPQSSGSVPKISGPETKRPKKPGKNSGLVVVKPDWTPEGWAPQLHQTRPSGEPSWSPDNWGRGYFVFSPPKKGKSVRVVEKNSAGAQTSSTSFTRLRRDIDRRGTVKIGARAGGYASSYKSGLDSGYADMGAGGVLGYRVFEPVGVEVGYTQYAPEMDFESTERSNSTIQGSAQLYLFPWTRVSPFLTGGYTVDRFAINDGSIDSKGMAAGPHGGLGVEWAVGQHLSLGLESRYIRYKNIDASANIREDALQVFGGLDIYF